MKGLQGVVEGALTSESILEYINNSNQAKEYQEIIVTFMSVLTERG